MDDRPRCYTFLPPAAGKPVRLAVGHYWGWSLFELGPAGAFAAASLLRAHQILPADTAIAGELEVALGTTAEAWSNVSMQSRRGYARPRSLRGKSISQSSTGQVFELR